MLRCKHVIFLLTSEKFVPDMKDGLRAFQTDKKCCNWDVVFCTNKKSLMIIAG